MLGKIIIGIVVGIALYWIVYSGFQSSGERISKLETQLRNSKPEVYDLIAYHHCSQGPPGPAGTPLLLVRESASAPPPHFEQLFPQVYDRVKDLDRDSCGFYIDEAVERLAEATLRMADQSRNVDYSMKKGSAGPPATIDESLISTELFVHHVHTVLCDKIWNIHTNLHATVLLSKWKEPCPDQPMKGFRGPKGMNFIYKEESTREWRAAVTQFLKWRKRKKEQIKG